MQLERRVALITGGGSGIGAATARLMAHKGASVAVAGIPADGVHNVVDELTAAGLAAEGIPTDVSKSGDVEAAVSRTVERFGRLDILVPNAAVQYHDRDVVVHELADDTWSEVLGVNLMGVFLTCKFGLRQLLRQGEGGAVVIVSSIAAIGGRSPNAAYVTSKGALLALGRHIAANYAAHGIRCNTVCPGALERTPNHDLHPNPAGRRERLEGVIPLGRLGTPEDIAGFIAFLASGEAGYATGANFVVDGGRSVV